MGWSLHLCREPREHKMSKRFKGRLFIAENRVTEQPRLPVLGDQWPDAHQALPGCTFASEPLLCVFTQCHISESIYRRGGVQRLKFSKADITKRLARPLVDTSPSLWALPVTKEQAISD